MSRDAYIHRAYPGGDDKPLLFLFHGTGGDENQLVALGPELLPGAGVVAPRGDVSENGAARFFRRTGEGVYDMADLAVRTKKMRGFVEAHVEAERPSAVLGLGYSNGANILASVVFAAPHLFDAVVLMHPLIPFEPKFAGSLARPTHPHHRGPQGPDLPRRHHRAAGGVAARGRRRRLDALARRRPRDQAGGAGGGTRVPGTLWRRDGERQMSEIVLEEGETKGRYVLAGADGAVAEMTFSKLGSRQIIIDHTEVPDAFRGQGAGLRLVTRAVEDARAAHKTIIPLCPFAASQFRRHPEWADVLKH